MIYDAHMHTVMSMDAVTTIREAMTAAAEKGVGLIVTDHMDWDFPAPFPDYRVDLDAFFREYAPLRNEQLLLGIELGVTARSLEKVNAIAASRDFDFVLGSVHVLEGEEVCLDMYAVQDEAEVYRRYLREAAAMVRAADIDSFAHVDYPLRFTSRELLYEEYEAEFAGLFDALLEKQVCLELNTARLDKPEAYANLLNIFRAWRAHGGRYVTVGSDGHNPGAIARHFSLACDLLREAGLTPVHFVARKMIIDTL